ncbi:putative inorganic phosphate cotransporter [Plodia interpunctella]|uniref:putative inorganic phosphate cotransporter n=1 Tax=Plodia interpunctella TaxID=58824 RepID=UPI0023689B1B|nr:putative inorganic phosphate cotransporter [Plodia interpunctella]
MSSQIKNDEAAEKPKSSLGVRHLQTVMLFFAMVIAYGMRVNMSIAIVAMTDSSREDTFEWSMQTQSVILSSFFWGYVVLQIPGGALAARFGSKILLLLCIGINSAASLLVPVAAYYGDWQSVCACRVVQGLSQGFLFPCTHNLIGKWVPLEEKSRLGAFMYAGSQLGTALQSMAAGYISEYWGWPFIFYSTGALGALWTVIYAFLGSSSPQTSRIISAHEKSYIEHSLGHVGQQQKLKTPWKSIVTSVPFISLIIAHCGQNWGLWTLMTETPSYMGNVLGVDIKSNGLMSAAPYLGMFIMSFPVGYISDYVLKKKWLSVTASRKISNSIGMYGPATILIILSYVRASTTAAVCLLTLTMVLNAGHYAGYLLVHIDMAPNFASILMGITNFFANIIGIIAPLVAGAIIKDENNADDWRNVFYLSSAVYIVFNTVFVIFGSSETQPWNEPEEGNHKETGIANDLNQDKEHVLHKI